MGLHTLVFFGAYLTTAAIGFITLTTLTHLLTPYEYGIYSTAVNFAFFAGSFFFVWIRLSAGRYEAEGVGGVSLGFWLSCYLAVLPIAAACFAVLSALGVMSPSVAFGVLFLTAAQNLFDLSQEIRRARAQPRRFAIVNFVRSVLSIALAIPVAYLYAKGVFVLFTLSTSFLLAALKNLYDIHRSRGTHQRSYRYREIVIYGSGLAASGLVFSSIGMLSRLMVVHFIGLEFAGPYNASLDLAGQIGGIVAMSVGSVVSPAIFRAYAGGDRERIVGDFLRGGELLLAAIVPSTVGLILLARPLAEVLTGAAFQGTISLILPWAIVGVAIANVNHYYLHIAFQMTTRTVLQVVSGVSQFIFLVVSTFLMIRANGLLGAAQALIITNALTMLVTGYLARQVFPVPFPLLSFLKVMLATGVMAAAVVAAGSFLSSKVALILVQAAVGVATFGLAALALDICGLRDGLRGAVARVRRLRG